jgi:hypothetical protein
MGLEAISDVMTQLTKLGTGEGMVGMTITDDPIILLPEPVDDAPKWRSETRQYFSVPQDWYNVGTPEGQTFFESELKLWNTPWTEREPRSNSYYGQQKKHRLATERVRTSTLWSSDNTTEENYARIVRLLKKYKQPFNDEDVREILSMKQAA